LTVLGGDPKTVVSSLAAHLLSMPLYPFSILSIEAAAKRKQALRQAAAGADQEPA